MFDDHTTRVVCCMSVCVVWIPSSTSLAKWLEPDRLVLLWMMPDLQHEFGVLWALCAMATCEPLLEACHDTMVGGSWRENLWSMVCITLATVCDGSFSVCGIDLQCGGFGSRNRSGIDNAPAIVRAGDTEEIHWRQLS